MTPHGRGNRRFVPRDARDHCRACNLSTIELSKPSICEVVGRAGGVPAEVMRYGLGPLRAGKRRQAGRQEFEEAAGKEMTMNIANPHGKKPIIIGLVSDTHGMIRNSMLDALAGVSQILHAGDVGGRDVLDALETIAPVQAVYGNVDPLDGLLPDQIAFDA